MGLCGNLTEKIRTLNTFLVKCEKHNYYRNGEEPSLNISKASSYVRVAFSKEKYYFIGKTVRSTRLFSQIYV